MIIDIHTHLGRTSDKGHSMDALRQYLDQAEISLAIVSHFDHSDAGQRMDELDSNLSSLRASRRDERLKPLYWVRPGHFDSNPYTCAGALEREPFVGLIFSPQLHGYSLADRQRLSPFLKALAHFQRPAVIYLSGNPADHVQDVYGLAQDWPSMPFVLCGATSILNNAAYRDLVQLASKRGDASLWLCTSHTSAEEISHTAEVIGCQSMMFGSAGMCEEDVAQGDSTLNELRERLSPENFQDIAFNNAADLFELRMSTEDQSAATSS